MNNWLLWKFLTIMLILCCFYGCGGDDGEDGSISDSGVQTEDIISTITIEIVNSKELEIGKEVQWRLKAEPAPTTDLAILLDAGDWVIIPKSENHSKTFIFTFLRNSEIRVEPLPVIFIVGEGSVLDLDELQKFLPTESIGGTTISEHYDFTAYKVGEPSYISVEVGGAVFVKATPADGVGSLPDNGSVRVTFTENPGEVTASAGTVAGSGRTRTISAPADGFPIGALALNLTWENGGADGHTLNYTVVAADQTPPEVIDSDPKSDAANLNPDNVFEDGIVVVFSEDVTGELILLDGDEDVGWISEVEGNKITLRGFAGQELSNETEYTVAGVVMDGTGNKTEVSIVFTTRAKE